MYEMSSNLHRGFFDYITNLSLQYGAAWIIVTQGLAWLTFFAIYGILVYAQFDVPALLKSWGYGPDMISLAEKGGLLALTFTLNRVLMPVRLGVSILLMPWLAPPINTFIAPYWSRYFPQETSAAPVQDKKRK